MGFDNERETDENVIIMNGSGQGVVVVDAGCHSVHQVIPCHVRRCWWSI